MKADTDNHSGSESSSSSGSDNDLNQSGLNSASGYATSAGASSHQQQQQQQQHHPATTSNNGYYNAARTVQANGNQGFSVTSHALNSHGAGMHPRQHPSPHHFSPQNHQDSRGFFLGAPSGYHGMSHGGISPVSDHDPFRHHHHHPQEETNRKREVRLMKNREAARECRRKKKEYIKCLENRVAVLENQNKALIEELKSLKELYTGKSFVQPKSEIL